MWKVTFARFFSICTCVIVCVQPTKSLNCAKGNNKENVVGSRTPCKGEKLFKVNERMARAAGVNVGECLCIAHRDEAVRANNRCSFPSSTSSEHSKQLVEIPRRLYHLIDELGATCEDYKPGSKWCTQCKKKEESLKEDEGYNPAKKRKVANLGLWLLTINSVLLIDRKRRNSKMKQI